MREARREEDTTPEESQRRPLPTLQHYSPTKTPSIITHMTLHLNWEFLFPKLISDGNQFLKNNTGTETHIGEDNWGQRCSLLFRVHTNHHEHGRIWKLMSCQADNPSHSLHFAENDPCKNVPILPSIPSFSKEEPGILT